MARAWLAVWLLASIALSSAALAKPRVASPDQQLTVILIRMTQTRDLGEARAALVALAKKHPRYAPALFDLGVVAEAQRDWAEAERAFRLVVALKKDPRYAAKAKRELAKLQEIRKREENVGPAGVRYDEAIARARAYLNAGFVREAGVEAASALGIDQRRWEAFAVIGSVLSALRDYESARASFRKGTQVAPPSVAAGLEKAAARASKEAQYQLLVRSAGEELRARQYAAAAQHFSSAQQLFPEREMMAYSAATALYAAKRRSEAKQLLTELISTGKDPVVVAKASDLMKRVDDALARVSVK